MLCARRPIATAGRARGVPPGRLRTRARNRPDQDTNSHLTGSPQVQAPAPLHDPWNVVDQIMRLARRPANEKIVGGDGVAKLLLKRLAPSLAQRIGGRSMHRTQIGELGSKRRRLLIIARARGMYR